MIKRFGIFILMMGAAISAALAQSPLSLMGVGPGSSGSIPPATISLTDTVVGTTASGTVTFSTRAVGAAQVDRVIIVAVNAETNSPGVASMALNGVGMTNAVTAACNTTPTPDTCSAIYYAPLSLGTTANITVNLAASVSDNVGISVFRMVGGTGALHAVASNATGAAVAPQIAAFGVAVYTTQTSGAAALTWTNATEATDFDLGGDRGSSATNTNATGSPVSPSVSAAVVDLNSTAAATFK